jgi:diadenylate cyclase
VAAEHDSPALIDALALVAPGTGLREGIDRVLQAKRGALIVVGDEPSVLSIGSGGFLLDAEFSPQRLSELAKMDGAIILASDASRIARANVHLVPRASIPTRETGTRHRTAERVARSIDVPVIAVSESMSTIAIYRNDRKHVVQPSSSLLERAGQALSTLQRFRNHVDAALATLSTLEVEDAVSTRDVVAVLLPGELVHRIATEIQWYLLELGEDGRLVWLQLEELTAGVLESVSLVVRDYVAVGEPRRAGHGDGLDGSTPPPVSDAEVDAAMRRLHALSRDEILDPTKVAETLGLGAGAGALDRAVEARGYRLLHRLPRFSDALIDRIVERFSTLSRIMGASIGDLEKVGGVGEAKARSVKDGLARLAEASILERYG